MNSGVNSSELLSQPDRFEVSAITLRTGESRLCLLDGSMSASGFLADGTSHTQKRLFVLRKVVTWLVFLYFQCRSTARTPPNAQAVQPDHSKRFDLILVLFGVLVLVEAPTIELRPGSQGMKITAGHGDFVGPALWLVGVCQARKVPADIWSQGILTVQLAVLLYPWRHGWGLFFQSKLPFGYHRCLKLAMLFITVPTQ